jgi:GNAT superfamily N-acetyltransferase
MKTPVAPTVRRAKPKDAARIAQLSEQLGYRSTTAETACRLAEIGSDGDDAVMVAEASGVVLGWIHVRLAHSLLTEGQAEIAGLVIAEQHRGRGIGRVLTEHAERWARDKGCRAVRVRSNVARTDAHIFYQRLGYVATKSQQVFTKSLAVQRVE